MLESRHLGLVMPDELDDIKEQLCEIADRLEKTIDMEVLLDIAAEAEEIGGCGNADRDNPQTINIGCIKNEFTQNVKTDCETQYQTTKIVNIKQMQIKNEDDTVNIAVAMDEAFCFYYEDNLRLLEKYGAKLQYFSPLDDTELPDNCDALLIGGGYPELYAKELSENISMRNSIKTAFKNGRQRLPNAVDLCICTHISIIYVKRTLVCRIMFLTWLELWMGSAISKVSWSGLDILNWKKNIAIFCHRMKRSGHMNFIIMTQQ